MIIFYEKANGTIVGVIEGRLHGDDQLKAWIGDPKEVDRIIVQWKPTGKESIRIVEEPIFEEYLDEDGFTETRQAGMKKKKIISSELEPDSFQKDILIELDKNQLEVYKYKVDLKTKELVKK